MAAKAGIAAQLGIATESSWGTRVAPATYLPFSAESLRLEKQYIETAGLRAGRFAQDEGLHSATTRSVAGSVTLDTLTKGMGKFFNLLAPGTITPTTVGTDGKKFTFPIGAGAPEGKSLSIQVGRPDVSGTVRPFDYAGCKLLGASWSIDTSGVLVGEYEFDGKDEDTAQTLGTYTAPGDYTVFKFDQGSVEFDDVAATELIKSASVSVSIPHDTERYGLGTSGVKREQLPNGLVDISMTVGLEFTSLTQHNAFKNATRRKVELLFTGPEFESGQSYALKFTLPCTVTTGEGPVVEGPEVLQQSLSLKALDNGTDAPLTIEYTTDDTAL